MLHQQPRKRRNDERQRRGERNGDNGDKRQDENERQQQCIGYGVETGEKRAQDAFFPLFFALFRHHKLHAGFTLRLHTSVI